MAPTRTTFNAQKIEACGDFFRSLSHPRRLNILEILEKGPLCVTDIKKELKIDSPTTSSHLKLLAEIGILNYKRSGKKTFYSLKPGIVEKIDKMIGMLEK